MEEYLGIAVQALWLALSVALIPVIAALVVALVFGVLQSMTQVRDETVSAVPKTIAVMVVVLITLPWMMSTISSFASNLFELMQRVSN